MNLPIGTQSAADPSHPDKVHDRTADPVITNPTSQVTVAECPTLNPVTIKSPFNGGDSDGQAEMYTQFYLKYNHVQHKHWVQHRMISVVNVFIFLRLLFFSLLLLNVT